MKAIQTLAAVLTAAMLLPAGMSAQVRRPAGSTSSSVSSRRVTSAQKVQTRVDKVQQPTNVSHQSTTHREVQSAASRSVGTRTRVAAGSSSSSVSRTATGTSRTSGSSVSRTGSTATSRTSGSSSNVSTGKVVTRQAGTSASSAASARSVAGKNASTGTASSSTKTRVTAGTLPSRTVTVSQIGAQRESSPAGGSRQTELSTGARVNPQVTKTVTPKVPSNYGRDNGRGKDYGRYEDRYRQPLPPAGYRFNGDPYARPRWEDYRAYQRYQVPYVIYRPVPVYGRPPVPPVPVYTQPQIVTRTNAEQIVLYTQFYSRAEAYAYVSQLLAEQYYDIAAYDTGYRWFATEITAVPIPSGWTNPYTHNQFRIRFNFDQMCGGRVRITLSAEWRESQLVTVFTPLRFQPSSTYSTYYAWNVLESLVAQIPHTYVYYR